MIEFSIVTGASRLQMPPPPPVKIPTTPPVATLPEIVLPVTVTLPRLAIIPPPPPNSSPVAEFPEMVLLMAVTSPKALTMPPP